MLILLLDGVKEDRNAMAGARAGCITKPLDPYPPAEHKRNILV
jgi:hypothetical protein